MTELWAAIALLLCLTSGFVLWAWWRPLPTSAAPSNRNDAVVALYRVKQSELEHELASAQINRSDYDQALAEMQRTLLLETSASIAPKSSSNHAGGVLLLLVALVIPVAGLLTYVQLGAYGSLEQSVNLKNTRSMAASAPSLTALISSLEGALEQHPNNPEGWYLLANSYMQLEQTPKGIGAFEQALNYVQTGSRQHAALLGQYAQALFFNDGEFSQRVNQAMAAAIAQDPKDVSALSLLGIQAFESQSYDAAVQFWQRALPRAGEGQGKASLKAGIASAQKMLNKDPSQALGATLPIKVSLANGLALPATPQAVLFVYARESDQGMPLFAIKLNPTELPLDVLLTDSMALQQGTRLADYKTLNISAHVAIAGVPGQKAGDLVSQTLAVVIDGVGVGAENKTVYLTIDQILK
jgi:cytochrome c-type biogenesis protein CcmH